MKSQYLTSIEMFICYKRFGEGEKWKEGEREGGRDSCRDRERERVGGSAGEMEGERDLEGGEMKRASDLISEE